MKVTDKYIYFWGEWPSNWYPCSITVKEDDKTLEFYTSEQYFMYKKAKTFGDEEIASRILFEGADPRQAKALGRQVRNYDDKVWNEKRYEIMLEANILKYSQNEELLKKLLDEKYKGKHFVEASPYDRIWGIGCKEKDALDDQSNWDGLNLLGKTLDETRDKLSQKS
jgi:ribA/ribD-fused uncharacterized protein